VCELDGPMPILNKSSALINELLRSFRRAARHAAKTGEGSFAPVKRFGRSAYGALIR